MLISRFLIASFLAIASSIVLAIPLEIVVSAPPGGSTDTFGRGIQRYLLKQNFNDEIIVVNKPGAEGRIGVRYAKEKPADGNTIIVASTGPFVFNKVMIDNLDYDPSEFDFVGPLIRSSYGLFVSQKSGIATVPEFLQKARTENINCGYNTAAGLFVINMLKEKYNFNNIVAVPFKGSQETLLGVLNGSLDCAVDVTATYKPMHFDQKLRIIAIASDTIDPDLPNAHLLKEVVPGATVYTWYGIGILKNVPSGKKEKLLNIIKQAYRDQEFKDSMTGTNHEVLKPVDNGQEFLTHEYKKFDTIRQRLAIEKIKK